MKLHIFRHPLVFKLIPWMVFGIFFGWGWRVENLFTNLPAYGDVLEVIWGIQWYYQSLSVSHVSPLFTSLVFHPLGWHTATLAYTPTLFLVSLPFYFIGGLGFAYNILAIAALLVTFSGMMRFSKLFVSQYTAIFVALAFTFWQTSWFFIMGHLNMAWISALLPWLAWSLERAKDASSSRQRRWLIIAGLLWGCMIHFALYGIFIGGLTLLIWGRQLLRPHRLGQVLIVGSIAFLTGLPVIGLYVVGTRADHTYVYGAENNAYWGASLNSLLVPSVGHSIEPIRNLARAFYQGPYNESGVMNLGLLTITLGLIGYGISLKFQLRGRSLVILTFAGIILSLGIFLRWNGQFVQIPIFRAINYWLWDIGHTLKPHVFAETIPEPFANGVPLPGFVLTAIVPFWEGARVASRYAVFGMLGLSVLAGIALDALPKAVRIGLIALWLVEILPSPTQSLPVPLQPHPAYAWLSQQSLQDGEGIIDLMYPTLRMSGEILWATTLHQKPTVSGSGSSWPLHIFGLWDYLANYHTALSDPETGSVFKSYGVRYILVHIINNQAQEMWTMVQNNPVIKPITCFDPLPTPNPWPYPICVGELHVDTQSLPLMTNKGWFGREPWGRWADGHYSTAGWIAETAQDYFLHLTAAPFCVPARQQHISIRVNGENFGSFRWRDCEVRKATILIPAPVVKRGWNDVSLFYDYAARPSETTHGQNPDSRLLSVAFLTLAVEEQCACHLSTIPPTINPDPLITNAVPNARDHHTHVQQGLRSGQ
ncbi:MAG: hypothetical protein KatS3mg055_1860 [Chloroflexus sp.]|uniref:hypothetical protein n=1 Tax=Chloroflexus sp. TaxID=1904827 RepID=UPI0021DCE858|nr:hypothetical protein [Chloroflexus sp.]GIV89342.1 MAG: hypothetical protein KatS3mg055_1860 [Chloroflexus sp.]